MVDFGRAARVMRNLYNDINTLRSVVDMGARGHVRVSFIGKIDHTTERIQVLTDRYNTLRDRIVTAVANLPIDE